MPDIKRDIRQLSLERKIGQLFMIGFKGTELPGETRRFMEKYGIGFTIFFSRNIETIPQVMNLTGEIHGLNMAVPPFICIDHEGGTVVHFRELAATVVSPMAVAATGDTRNAYRAGNIIGGEMKTLGIDGVLAPVLDVNVEEDNPIIGIRAFSDDPGMVAEYAEQLARGLNDAGIFACGKHFPGHGATIADSHLEIPEVGIDNKFFEEFCLSPFRQMVNGGIDAIMTSHVSFPEIFDSIATFSPELIAGTLRNRWGFDGVVLSDCLEMVAVKEHFEPHQIVEKCMNAGLDIMIPSHNLDYQNELVEALLFYVKKGKIPEKRIDESVERVLKLKEKYLKLNAPTGERAPVSSLRADGGYRPNLEEEQRIADASVTLLRNRRDVIPFEPAGKKVLIIEWEKVKATMALSTADRKSMLEPVSGGYFEDVEIEILPLRADGKYDLPRELVTKINESDLVIAGLYSRTPQVAKLQAEGLKRILALRPDTVAAALGNPYDIKFFPEIDTYIATYGFRRVQLEALFRLITGKIRPAGTLPVEIHGLFPRGAGIRNLNQPMETPR